MVLVFYRVFLGFTEFFFRFYLVSPSFNGFYWTLPGFTGFYRVLLGFTGFYWVLLGFTGFYFVLLVLTGGTGFLPSFTGLNVVETVLVIFVPCCLFLQGIHFSKVFD